MALKFIKFDWNERMNSDKYFLLEGGDSKRIMKGEAIYNFARNCWEYAPCYYDEFILNGKFDGITEERARKIVEENGGTNFDNLEKVLYDKEKDDEYFSHPYDGFGRQFKNITIFLHELLRYSWALA